MKRTGIKRTSSKPRKRKAAGTACHIGKCRRNQVITLGGNRYCPLHGADKLFSEHVRSRGRCEVQPWFSSMRCNGDLQCSHVISRRYHATRWDALNAVSACAAHHLYTTHHPMEWEEAVNEHHRASFDWLRRYAVSNPPQDPNDVIARLLKEAS